MSELRTRAELAEQLAAVARARLPSVREIRRLHRLPRGLSRETWSFEVLGDDVPRTVLLRRSPGGKPAADGLSPASEAALYEHARRVGVPSPSVYGVLGPGDGLGEAFLLERVPGECQPRRILRHGSLAAVRPQLARQLGQLLARIHTGTSGGLGVAVLDPEPRLDALRARYEALEQPRPICELAFCWLSDHLLEPAPAGLVHGNFRNGNLVVGESGVSAVLDWECAHLGDPAEDVGWLCAPLWRFGELALPVGGFGALGDLLDAYAEAGGRSLDPARIEFWQTFAMLERSVDCMGLFGGTPSDPRADAELAPERAAVARCASAAEFELLVSLDPEF